MWDILRHGMTDIASDAWDESRQATLIARILSGEWSLEAACRLLGLSAETVRNWVPVYRHRTLQALDEKLQQTSLISAVNEEWLGNAAYTGSLDDIPIPDLLQTCQMGAKDGVITITRGGERSSIWCQRGAIVDAESSRLRGEAAVYRILNFDSGQVSADFRFEPRPRTVSLPCHVLLFEAARHKDECARLIKQLDGVRSIFLQAPGAWAADTSLTEREVLYLCDGKRGVSDVLTASDLSDLDTLSTMASLVARGYLLRDGVSTPPPPVVAGPGSEDWGRRSSLYLPLPQVAPPVVRSKRGAPLLIGLGLVLGILVSFAAASLYPGMPIPTVEARAASFVVEATTEPAHAQLWLDGLRVGEGEMRRELPRDGKLHQLAAVAPGHMPTTLVFADSAPRFRIVLDKLSPATYAPPSP